MDRPDSKAAELLRAALFAARVHATHRRKGAAAEPYVNHVLEVAQILARQASSGQKVAIMLMPSPKLRGVVPGRNRNEQPELRGKQLPVHLLELGMKRDAAGVVTWRLVVG